MERRGEYEGEDDWIGVVVHQRRARSKGKRGEVGTRDGEEGGIRERGCLDRGGGASATCAQNHCSSNHC